MIKQCSSSEFRKAFTSDPADRFAKTFAAKAKAHDLWDLCVGVWKKDILLGAAVTTCSVRSPKISNLQLLHTFAAHRGQGIGTQLVEHSLAQAIRQEAVYWRVSSEPASVAFYKKRGLKFWGRQKSGTELCIFKIGGPNFSDAIYDPQDEIIRREVYKKGRGGCVVIF